MPILLRVQLYYKNWHNYCDIIILIINKSNLYFPIALSQLYHTIYPCLLSAQGLQTSIKALPTH